MNGQGQSPLYVAPWNGHATVVARLLAAGADFAKTSNFGHTPLAKAESAGHTEVVELLRTAAANNAQ